MSFGSASGQGWLQLGELGTAFVLSSLIGLERELRQKSAGLRTYTVVGLASALFLLVSKYGFSDVLRPDLVVLDPSRVAAGIVSGIGFIGGGIIFVRGDGVRGLTTAASIWLTAAVGMACGAGLPLLAVAATVAHFVIILGFPHLQRRLPKRVVHVETRVTAPEGERLVKSAPRTFPERLPGAIIVLAVQRRNDPVKHSFSQRAIALASAAVLCGGLSACKSSSGGGTVQLSGAGSTFVNPVMSRWTAAYQQAHNNVEINYQSIGSGGGIQQVKNQTVDFGASDAALTDKERAAMTPVIQIPETSGPVCITYNLPSISQPLQISPDVLTGMFLGTIKKWDDPKVTKDNPGVKLPSLPVVIVHRAESSGTTSIFTTYLAAVNPEWKSKVGAGKSVSWPVGLGGKGNEGVTGQIKQSPGALGYVELAYAVENKLPLAKIENQAGKYIAPSAAGTTASIAAFATELAQNPATPIVNPPASAADAYPISGLTFLIVPTDGPDKAKRTALKGFLEYIINDGQAAAADLNYAPLPDSVKQYDETQLKTLAAAGQPIQ